MSVAFINPFLTLPAGEGATDVVNSSEIEDQFIYHAAGPNKIAYAAYEVNADGKLSRWLGVNRYFIANWLAAGSAAEFEVRATVVSGTLDSSSSAIDTWLPCSTTRTWAVRRSFGFQACTLTVQWRSASEALPILAEATIELWAEVEL